MFLSKLEILGFKSFANRTLVNYNRGITGIVGPNGCGKTNIVDAIRWVLGEQRTTTLRMDKMENVIFNGTRSRKPMGMAEVSMTLVNDNGILPTEYSEVTITRRIFRSGESEYLLNKNICRLKDITNLFMDTGIGANAYSVIELKMIETILSNKTEERRRLFEEAAGVNKYKLRRRLSLKKLDEVKTDLTRVNDIVSEVDKTVRSLERQAKKADQYTQIQTVLREKEIDLSEHEYALFNEKKSALKSEIIGLTAQKDQIDIDIRKIENELIGFRKQINAVDSELQNKRSEIAKNSEHLFDTQKNISVTEERLKSLKNNRARLEQEIADLTSQLEDTEFAIQDGKEELATFTTKLEGKKYDIERQESLVVEKRLQLDQQRSDLKIINEDKFTLLKEIAEKENVNSGYKKELDTHRANIEKQNTKIQNVTNHIAKTVGYIDNLVVEKEETQKKLTEAGLQITLREKEKAALEEQVNKLKNEEVEQKTLFAGLKEKINFLQTLISNLEGISKGARVLIDSDEWTTKSKSIFADIGNTNEEFRFALEAALKSVLNNLLVDNLSDLESAVDHLKKNDLGKASFYLLQNENDLKKSILNKLSSFSIKRKAKKIAADDGFVGWAKDFVETDSNWKPYFDKVLERIVVAKDLRSAISLSKFYPEFSFATLEGDLLQNNGIVEAGSLPKQDETLFGRRQLLENLKKEFPAYEGNLERLKSTIQETETKLSQIDLKNLSDREKLIANDIANIDKQISQFEFERKKADEDVESTEKEIQELASKAHGLDVHIEQSLEDLEILNEKRNKLEETIAAHEAKLKEFETDFTEQLAEQNQRRVDFERLSGQIENTKNSITRSEQNLGTIKASIEKRKSDLTTNEEESRTLNEILGEAQDQLEKINSSRAVMLNAESEISGNLRAIKSEASQFENQLSQLRYQRQEVSDKIYSLDLKDNELNFKINNILEHIKETYSVDLVVKEFEDLHSFNYDEVNQEVHRYKDKIKSLGPVNLLAYSEYDEEKQRLDFLLKQRTDLIESEKDLIKTINEINETAQKLFMDTFDAIRQNFTNIFQTLFNPGDEADLILEENIDPLEAKIEIMAKPKGKRPTTIELLSGGEKTLTATALLFAIYLVKPSPFCVLDEVDAPLDDANIDRFTKLIKEFSDKTQFIIVTHNKRTMESAETMYGVTMQEEGVSKLVGVRFEDIPEYGNG
ncbi:MAG: Smc family protein [Ignavibacteria bacterium]|nr:MAG: Smc family protein [Ignavibacteria bacterium]KAF0160392.1 MAG: Smc family protein [Ignavibacteria bacterium]